MGVGACSDQRGQWSCDIRCQQMPGHTVLERAAKCPDQMGKRHARADFCTGQLVIGHVNAGVSRELQWEHGFRGMQRPDSH